MHRSLLPIACLIGGASLPAAALAGPLSGDLDPVSPMAPEPAEPSDPADSTHFAYSEINFASARSAGDTILYNATLNLGLITPQVDAAVGFAFASAPLLTGERNAFTLTPSVGRHLGWDSGREIVTQLYGLAQLPIQWRSGAGLAREMGYAVAGEVGGRLWSCSVSPRTRGMCAGIGVALRYRYHLSEFQMSSAVLPAGSSVLSLPISVYFAARLK